MISISTILIILTVVTLFCAIVIVIKLDHHPCSPSTDAEIQALVSYIQNSSIIHMHYNYMHVAIAIAILYYIIISQLVIATVKFMKYTHKDEDHNYFVDDMAMQPAEFNQANYNNNVGVQQHNSFLYIYLCTYTLIVLLQLASYIGSVKIK